MAGNFSWNGPAVQAKIESELKRRIKASCIVVRDRAAVLLSVEGTAKIGKGKRAKLIYGARTSKPGQSPFKQTGRLHASVAFEVDGLVGRVGTSVWYGRVLQTEMDRPWLDRALNQSAGRIRTILSAPLTL